MPRTMSLLNELFTIAAAGGVLPPPTPAMLPEIELSDEWKNFERELAKFKQEYIQTRHQAVRKEAEYSMLQPNISVIRNAIENIDDEDVRVCLESVLDNYKSQNNIEQKQRESLDLLAKVKAMEHVLIHTNAQQYSRFTCPICMEHHVDTFLDPCGHLICETCLVQTRDVRKCPTCRANIVPKRMFTSMD